jgi:hypothetical protein
MDHSRMNRGDPAGSDKVGTHHEPFLRQADVDITSSSGAARRGPVAA